MTEPMAVIALGVHVVDVLVRPVQEIPVSSAGAIGADELAAAKYLQGLGSDHGEFDLAVADAFAARIPTLKHDPREIASR